MPTFRAGAVTVGIPTWNRRPLLQRALASVLAQTYPDIQIVISDDASTDDTWDYVSQLTDPRIVKIRLPQNGGMVANFNSALRGATSEFFLMLNDDDALEPTALEKMVRAFLQPPNSVPSHEVGVVWVPFINVNEKGEHLWAVRGGPAIETSVDLIEGLFNGTRGPLISGVMMRTEQSLAIGGYDPEAGPLADSANWGKVALRHRYSLCVDEPLMLYAVHSGGMTTTGAITFWIEAKKREIEAYVSLLRAQGDEAGAQRLIRAGKHTIANSIITVLLRFVGKPGWMRAVARESWRTRQYMFTPFVAKRLILDGWKLLRLKRKG